MAVQRIKTEEFILKKWFITCSIIFIAFIINIPFINAVWTSFKSDGDITTFPPEFIFKPVFDHFTEILFGVRYDFPAFFLNSMILSISTSIIVILITLPSAYSIVRLKFGSRKLLGFTAGLRLFPPIVFAIPYFILFQFVGLVDTLAGLVLMNTFLNIPLGLLLLVGFLKDIPAEIEDSAKMDGCSVYMILWKIIVPLMRPGILSVGILTFIFTWNDYLFALIVSLDSSTPVTLGATMFITSYGIEWGNVAAVTVLSVMPPLLFVLIAQKYLVSGLSMGAVKG